MPHAASGPPFPPSIHFTAVTAAVAAIAAVAATPLAASAAVAAAPYGWEVELHCRHQQGN